MMICKSILKDIISFFVYAFVCPFMRGRGAVLVYHSVDNNVKRGNDPDKINVSPVRFREHMAYIAKRKDRFTVTFDDSYGNVYLNAFPIVQEYGIRSTVFVLTDFVDKKLSMDNFFNGIRSPEPLTWDEINEMKSAGLEIGCHSGAHKNVAQLNKETLQREIASSRKRILDMTGTSARSFAYPFGNADSFNERTESALKKSGYERIYTNIMGMDNSGSEPFRIRRIRIYNTDNIFRFKIKIAGAYNWVDMIRKEPA